MIKKWKITLLVIMLFVFISLILLSIFIATDLISKRENIYEYYVYKSTNLNFDNLKNFCLNSTKDQQEYYYTYFNNLLLYPPEKITIFQMHQIENLLKISFINPYDWNFLIISGSIDLFLIFLFISLFFLYYKKMK